MCTKIVGSVLLFVNKLRDSQIEVLSEKCQNLEDRRNSSRTMYNVHCTY